MIISVGVAALALVVAFLAQEMLNDQYWTNILVSLFMAFSIVAVLTSILREHIGRCPTCTSWLRSKGKVSKNETKMFVCKRCNIAWDTTIQKSGAGE